MATIIAASIDAERDDMTQAELDEIRQFVAELKMPPDASALERMLFAAVKRDMAMLIREIDRLYHGTD